MKTLNHHTRPLLPWCTETYLHNVVYLVMYPVRYIQNGSGRINAVIRSSNDSTLPVSYWNVPCMSPAPSHFPLSPLFRLRIGHGSQRGRYVAGRYGRLRRSSGPSSNFSSFNPIHNFSCFPFHNSTCSLPLRSSSHSHISIFTFSPRSLPFLLHLFYIL